MIRLCALEAAAGSGGGIIKCQRIKMSVPLQRHPHAPLDVYAASGARSPRRVGAHRTARR
jgi:hypothetical protein